MCRHVKPRYIGYFQHLFFAFYQPNFSGSKASEKAVPPVSTDITKRSFVISLQFNKPGSISGVFARWPGKKAEHSFFLDFFVSFFVKKKRKGLNRFLPENKDVRVNFQGNRRRAIFFPCPDWFAIFVSFLSRKKESNQKVFTLFKNFFLYSSTK